MGNRKKQQQQQQPREWVITKKQQQQQTSPNMYQIEILHNFVPNLWEVYLFFKNSFLPKCRPIWLHCSQKTDLTAKMAFLGENLVGKGLIPHISQFTISSTLSKYLLSEIHLHICEINKLTVFTIP